MTDEKKMPINAAALMGALTDIGGAIGTLRKDGWSNSYTGIGTSRDKQTRSTFCGDALLGIGELSVLFHSDDIAHRIITTRPDEMLRAGYKLMADDEELTQGLMEDAERLEIDRNVFEGMVWGGLYGGAALIIGVNDRRPPEMKLNDQAAKSVDYLTVLDKRYINPHKFYGQSQMAGGLGYGKPEQYMVTSMQQAGLAVVHESRVIRFEGAMTDAQMRRQLWGWSISELQRPYEVMRLFGMSFASVGHLLQDASQGVFKMKDLMHMIANNRDALMKRMELVDTSRSVARAVLLDADMEDFDRVATSFAGLPELLDRIMQRMSAATRIPVTLLMGRSAAGMNATGDSDFRAFYDSVKAEQNKKLKPILLKIYRLLATARGGDPTKVRIEFNPLWDMNDVESSLMEKQDADRDVALIGAGVLLPEEVALRISKGRRGVCDTEIDVKAREKSLKIEIEMMTDPEQHMGPADEAKAQADLAKAKAPAPAPGGKAPAKP